MSQSKPDTWRTHLGKQSFISTEFHFAILVIMPNPSLSQSQVVIKFGKKWTNDEEEGMYQRIEDSIKQDLIFGKAICSLQRIEHKN
jgi:hypothetical protein